jgi:hypothetical protein
LFENDLTCEAFSLYCPNGDLDCFEADHMTPDGFEFSFSELDGFKDICLACNKIDYTHGTFLFNTFIFLQFFNEFNSRLLLDKDSLLETMFNNPTFLIIALFQLIFQIVLVQCGGDFFYTTPLSIATWAVSIGFGLLSLPVGYLSRTFIVIQEEPNSFYICAEHNQEQNFDFTRNEIKKSILILDNNQMQFFKKKSIKT